MSAAADSLTLLVDEIHTAFAGVQLGNGIGLWEAQDLDYYLVKPEPSVLYKKDEIVDWHKISLDDLNRCCSSWSFLDAEGWRFYLPPLLLADLGMCNADEEFIESNRVSQSDSPFEAVWHLTSLSEYINPQNDDDSGFFAYYDTRFSLLNQTQTLCLVHFLEYRQHQRVKKYWEKYHDWNLPCCWPIDDKVYKRTKRALEGYWYVKAAQFSQKNGGK